MQKGHRFDDPWVVYRSVSAKLLYDNASVIVLNILTGKA